MHRTGIPCSASPEVPVSGDVPVVGVAGVEDGGSDPEGAVEAPPCLQLHMVLDGGEDDDGEGGGVLNGWG